jgi:hypothetical protein
MGRWMSRSVVAVSLLLPCGARAQQAPAWHVCIEVHPGVQTARPYFRDCRPLPAACRDTPTCACMARAMPGTFGRSCRRVGRRFIRSTLHLP